MSDTLEIALTSVLEQLDEKYEVLVVDDGSSDNSLEILQRMEGQYSILRVISLSRDSKRPLGLTRNFSIQNAKGKYVILHIDADDVWQPYIKEFVAVFHKIEKCIGRRFLLSGQQINIGLRDFLLEHGPYRSLHYADDRDMWRRLAAIDAYIPLEHKIFRTRLKRSQKVQLLKSLWVGWFMMIDDLRACRSRKQYVFSHLFEPILLRMKHLSYPYKMFRAVFVIPALTASLFEEPLSFPDNMESHADFVAYRERVRGTYPEIMARYGCEADFSCLSQEAKEIFSETPSYIQPRGPQHANHSA